MKSIKISAFILLSGCGSTSHQLIQDTNVQDSTRNTDVVSPTDSQVLDVSDTSTAQDTLEVSESSSKEVAPDVVTDVTSEIADVTIDTGPTTPEWNAFLPLVSGTTTNGAPGMTLDITGHGYAATYAHGATFERASLHVTTNSGDVSIPPQNNVPAIDMTGSFSVSAWIMITDITNYRTFVSADGHQASSFYLQFRPYGAKNFAFAMTPYDSNAGANNSCELDSNLATPTINTVYYVVATRDGATGTNTLYVNGALAGTTVCTGLVGWAAQTIGIGHGMYGGANTDYASGNISGLGLINRVLTADEVTSLYKLGKGANGARNPPPQVSPSLQDASIDGSPPSYDAGPLIGPCDIYASGSTPCVAAHSTVRALYGGYSGNLYQVRRVSDGMTKDIGTVVGGFADSTTQDTFCFGTTCTFSVIYDQSANGNDLSSAPAGGAVQTPDAEAIASAHKVTLNGHPAYGIYVTPGVGYRSGTKTKLIATGNQPEGEYMVTSGQHYNSGCCFDYGNAELSSYNTGNGHMEAVYFGTATWWGTGSGDGPWVMVDMENGIFSGSNTKQNIGDLPITNNFITAMVKGNSVGDSGVGTFTIKVGDAQSGTLSTMWDGARPTGYSPMYLEGSIVLGIGGDNSNEASGTFYEGVMTSGYPTNTTEDTVQANILSAGYQNL